MAAAGRSDLAPTFLRGRTQARVTSLPTFTKSAVEVGGVEENGGLAAIVKSCVQEGSHLDVDVSADAAHLGFGDSALDVQSRPSASTLRVEMPPMKASISTL